MAISPLLPQLSLNFHLLQREKEWQKLTNKPSPHSPLILPNPNNRRHRPLRPFQLPNPELPGILLPIHQPLLPAHRDAETPRRYGAVERWTRESRRGGRAETCGGGAQGAEEGGACAWGGHGVGLCVWVGSIRSPASRFSVKSHVLPSFNRTIRVYGMLSRQVPNTCLPTLQTGDADIKSPSRRASLGSWGWR